jgi:triphosphoribosyl-dephospho-CoA synthase
MEWTESSPNPNEPPPRTPGRLAQLACILEVMAPKPGNVQRHRDLPGLHVLDFLASALAIAEPLDRAEREGVGVAVERAIEATHQLVATNTNLGMVLLLAPMAAVPSGVELQQGVESVLAAATIDDSRAIFRAIRRARPGGMGSVPEQDIADEPTLPLRAVMTLAADRDLIARQYADGFREVFDETLAPLRETLASGRSLQTAIVAAHLAVLSRHADSLIVRKAGLECAREVSRRAAEVLSAGWPDRSAAVEKCAAFDDWLRDPSRRFNPGTTADLVTAALFAALRDGTIRVPFDVDSTA